MDSISDFSSYGAGTVHLGAPGEGILSTVLNGQYASEGWATSMATAYVTGVIGLLAAQDPSRDWRAIKNLILAGAVPPTQGLIPTVTGGRLRAINSMSCTQSIIEGRTRPAAFDTITLAVGAELPLQAININCAQPNGNVPVTVQPGGETVTLLDDGQGYDEVAGDGVYSGRPPHQLRIDLHPSLSQGIDRQVDRIGCKRCHLHAVARRLRRTGKPLAR